jgi:hypothetical protein
LRFSFFIGVREPQRLRDGLSRVNIQGVSVLALAHPQGAVFGHDPVKVAVCVFEDPR